MAHATQTMVMPSVVAIIWFTALVLGGKSLLWGPVATSMVFGLFVATTLTLFLMPILFRAFMPLRGRRIGDATHGAAPFAGFPATDNE